MRSRRFKPPGPARVGLFCLLALVAMPGFAAAQTLGPWWTWPTVDGDWAGYRHLIEERGLVFSGSTVTDLQGNVSGGSHRAFAPANSSLLALDADLQKIAGLPHLEFHVEFTSAAGENLSTKSLGNSLQVATAFAQEGYYLGQMYLQQKLFDQKLLLQAGRMTTANNFAGLSVFDDYVSYANNPNPISLTNNVIYFTSLPSVTWGVVGTWTPSEAVALAAGVYDTNLTSALPDASRHGIDFSFHDSGGPMEIAQLTYSPNNGRADTGLPGNYNLGGYYSGADYQTVSGASTKRGNYGFYLEAEQTIYRRGGPASGIGLTPWFTITYNPEHNVNQLPILAMVGAAYTGLIRGRLDDTTAVAFYYGRLNTVAPATAAAANAAFPVQSSSLADEKVLELDYTYWATPWLSLTPDLQYIFNPGGQSGSRNAAVLGLQFEILF